MSDIPIIFSAPMVRALLDCRKTMTRRMAWQWVRIRNGIYAGTERQMPSPWRKVKPGDRLWVRENLAVMANLGVWHDASNAPAAGKFLDDVDPRGCALLERYAPTEATDSACIPSIHMPRWASRLTLIVTATKIEHLRDISERDAVREGIYCKMDPVIGLERNGIVVPDDKPVPLYFGMDDTGACLSAKHAFQCLWVGLHGIDSWRADPEVVALTFRVIKANIDTPEAHAA